MSLEFEIKMTKKIMYDFMLYTTYTSIGGLFGACLGAGALALGVRALAVGTVESSAPFFLVAILFLVATPLNMWLRSAEQVAKTPMFQKPIVYEFTEEGVRLSQDGESVLNEWKEFHKAVSTGKSLILYVTRVRALILPRQALGEDYPAVVRMVSEHMPPKKVKIRHVSVV